MLKKVQKHDDKGGFKVSQPASQNKKFTKTNKAGMH
jgi:hypothetical protein